MSTKTNLKNKTDEQLVVLFNALGDQTRYSIINLLMQNQDICVSELAEHVGISTPGASQQLKLLEASGLVSRHRKGQKICYKLDMDDGLVRSIIDFINKV